MTRPKFEVTVAAPAALDITEMLNRSAAEFGIAVARRYEALIVQSLIDIGDDPERPGSKEHLKIMIPGARTYHLAFSRRRVKGQRVKEPCHFLLYRYSTKGIIEVARILHDSRDLVRHLPEDFKS